MEIEIAIHLGIHPVPMPEQWVKNHGNSYRVDGIVDAELEVKEWEQGRWTLYATFYEAGPSQPWSGIDRETYWGCEGNSEKDVLTKFVNMVVAWSVSDQSSEGL